MFKFCILCISDGPHGASEGGCRGSPGDHQDAGQERRQRRPSGRSGECNAMQYKLTHLEGEELSLHICKAAVAMGPAIYKKTTDKSSFPVLMGQFVL